MPVVQRHNLGESKTPQTLPFSESQNVKKHQLEESEKVRNLRSTKLKNFRRRIVNFPSPDVTKVTLASWLPFALTQVASHATARHPDGPKQGPSRSPGPSLGLIGLSLYMILFLIGRTRA